MRWETVNLFSICLQPDPITPHSADTKTLKTLAVGKARALEPNDTVETAGDRMREHETGQWPVADGRKLVGVVDDKNPD